MSCVDRDLIRKLRLHLLECEFGVFEHDRVLNSTEADGNTRRVGHGMRPNAYSVTGKCAGGRAQYETECVLGIKFETRQFGSRIRERGWDRR